MEATDASERSGVRFLLCFTGLLSVKKGVTSYSQKTHKLKEKKMAEIGRGRDHVQMCHTNIRAYSQWELGLSPSSDHGAF